MGSKKQKPSFEPTKIASSQIAPSETFDIGTRRRLSTPKASPIPDRTPSQKSSKISQLSSKQSEVSSVRTPKTSWFKSLERLSRKKSKVNLLNFIYRTLI